jgi:transcriptional regulator with XRE-family HTH domain
MALSDDEKVIRRRVIGTAIRLLREHLSLSQPGLARMLGDDTDPVSVSRWERGIAMPHPDKRETLAGIARKNKRSDLEATFLDPVQNWKATLNDNGYVADLITLLEICAINENLISSEKAGGDEWYVVLAEVAAQIRDRLVRRVRQGGTVRLLTDAQRHLWFGMLDELGINKPRRHRGKKREAGKTTR